MLTPPSISIPEPAAPRRTQRFSGTGTLRVPVGLPRRRGLLGDLQYVYTVAFGVARARRDLVEVNRMIEAASEARDERVVELGRRAVADLAVTLPIVERAREELLAIEESRSIRAGQVAACDEELAATDADEARIQGDRRSEIDGLRAEVEQVRAALAPLEQRLTHARRRAQRLASQLGDLDEEIADGEAQLSAGKTRSAPAATAEASIATLRAERQSVAAEEPVLASQIDAVEPALASLRARLADLLRQIARVEADERADRVRTGEIRAAIVARKAVEDRAVSDLGVDQERALRELGDRLAVDRPGEFQELLVPVDRSELRLAELQRRLLELGELVGAVNRRALARGVTWLALIALGAAAITTALWLLLD